MDKYDPDKISDYDEISNDEDDPLIDENAEYLNTVPNTVSGGRRRKSRSRRRKNKSRRRK